VAPSQLVLTAAMPEPEREELHAALEARRELGPEYEPQIVDSFLERIEQRLEHRRHRPARQDRPPQPPALVVPLATVGMGIATTGAASGIHPGGFVVAIIAWIAIAIVNVAYAMRRR
jgi:hypothetical protein